MNFDNRLFPLSKYFHKGNNILLMEIEILRMDIDDLLNLSKNFDDRNIFR